MDIQKTSVENELKFEIDKAPVLNYENEGKGTAELNTKTNSSEVNEKQFLDEYFISIPFKQDEIDIKTEYEEDDQFSTEEFIKKQIQKDYFDSIKHEDINIKSEDEEADQFSTRSSALDSENVLYRTKEAAGSNDLLPLNTNNHHANWKESSVFKCLKCSYQTHKKVNIRRHFLCHMPKTFECPLCPYKTNKKNILREHKLVHIPKEEAKVRKCPNCPFTSKWRGALMQHLLIHKKPDELTWYQCLECPYKTKFKFDLKKHARVHKNELSVYKCTMCSYEAFSKCRLTKHLNGVHTPQDIPLVSCPEEECSFKTRYQSYLELHIKKLHKCNEIFKCSKCLFETKYIRTFRAHKSKHEDPDKWLSCLLCPYKTIRRFDLTRHTLTHKSCNELRWFQCSACSFKTIRKHELTSHKVKHGSDRLYCYLCSFRTRYKQSLTNHIHKKHRDAEGNICGPQ